MVWYILDTGISLLSRVVFNAYFNTLVLILFGTPLLFTRATSLPQNHEVSGSVPGSPNGHFLAGLSMIKSEPVGSPG
jgi:hypothetical protein